MIAIAEEEAVLKRGLKDLNGQNYMEFYIGDFENSVEYWNEQSYYLHHAAYKPLHRIFKAAKKGYNDYNVNEFKGDDLESLKVCLVTFLDDSKNVNHKLAMNPETHSIVSGIVAIISNCQHSQTSLWILGM